MMENLKKVGLLWKEQSEFFKIMAVGLVVWLFIFYLRDPVVQLVTLEKYQNPETGEIVYPSPCTLKEGPNQCRVFKEEFTTQDVYTTTVSRKKGSLTCCLTTTTSTTGGSVTVGTESCWTNETTSRTTCPRGYHPPQ